MKETELNQFRIGNWIKRGHDGRIDQIEEILQSGVFLPSDALVTIPSDIELIPLSPEILEKAGFSNDIEEEIPEDADFLVFFKDNISVEIIPDAMGLNPTFEVTLYNDVIDVDGNYASDGVYVIEYMELYLHQLKNLFFALTQTELNFKN